MRASTVSVTVMLAALAVVVHSAPTPDTASKILADARQALGGDQRLSSVRTFTAKGTIARAHSYGIVEIACELPDKFVQKTSNVDPAVSQPPSGHPGGGVLHSYGHDTILGFNAGQVIYNDSSGAQDSSLTAFPGRLPPTQQELSPFLPNAHQAFVDVTLALFAASFSGVPLQFIDAPGPDDLPTVIVKDRTTAVMRFDRITHLPASLGGLRYSDYRDVDGVKVPFRLTWMSGAPKGAPADIREEWSVKEFHVNATIDPKVFRPSGR